VGWLKRGPSGIIGTNIPDAKDTATTIANELKKTTPLSKDNLPLEQLLRERKIQVVDWKAYQRLDIAERQHKRHPSQPREKIVDRRLQLEAALD